MKNRFKPVIFPIILVAACLAATTPAWAVLGQPVQSVTTDQTHLRAQMRTLPVAGVAAGATAPYTVLQLDSGNGILVSEYVNPAGMVFGVTWQGPAVPDLSQLLGSYFSTFQTQLRAAGHFRGPWAMRNSNLVVELGGHMRAYVGRAFDPTLVPASVSPAVIQ